MGQLIRYPYFFVGQQWKGIERNPEFPSNYYWAARILLSSTEEVWGMIYGEIFMNLERNSTRTAEISKLLYDTYKSEITISDSSASVSFSQNFTLSVDDIKDTANFKLPFGMMYEGTLAMAIASEKNIDLNSLDRIRTSFLNLYFQGDFDKKYPNVLFDYEQTIERLGHLEAYNHWILMKGDEESFDQWAKENNTKWQAFAKWFQNNPLSISERNKFYRAKY